MSEAIFTEVSAEPRSKIASSVIREAIVTGRLVPGQDLNEAELARQLGVSRAPLREALRQLEKEGLVSHAPYKGTVVTPLTRRDVDELQTFRRMLEIFAAEQWMLRATSTDFDGLNSLTDEMEQAATEGDIEHMNSADIAFHTRVIDLSEHYHLREVWANYVSRIRRILTLRNLANRDPAAPIALHRELVRAFRSGDLDTVHRCYEQHGADASSRLSHLFAASHGSDRLQLLATDGSKVSDD